MVDRESDRYVFFIEGWPRIKDAPKFGALKTKERVKFPVREERALSGCVEAFLHNQTLTLIQIIPGHLA